MKQIPQHPLNTSFIGGIDTANATLCRASGWWWVGGGRGERRGRRKGSIIDSDQGSQSGRQQLSRQPDANVINKARTPPDTVTSPAQTVPLQWLTGTKDRPEGEQYDGTWNSFSYWWQRLVLFVVRAQARAGTDDGSWGTRLFPSPCSPSLALAAGSVLVVCLAKVTGQCHACSTVRSCSHPTSFPSGHCCIPGSWSRDPLLPVTRCFLFLFFHVFFIYVFLRPKHVPLPSWRDV